MIQIKNGYKLCPVGDEYVVIAEGTDYVDFARIVTLNSSAAYLWEQLAGRTFDLDYVVATLTSHYDVSPATARTDARHFIDALLAEGVALEV